MRSVLIWVQDKLRKKGISQAELARRIGITPRSLCNKFGGKQPFLYDEIDKICDELDIRNPFDYTWRA